MNHITPRAVTLVLVLPWLTVSAGCGGEASPDGGAATAEVFPSLHALRNRGKLHADRDSDEGFVEAARIFRDVVARAPDSFDDHLNLIRVLAFVSPTPPDARDVVARARALLGEGRSAELDYAAGLVEKRLSGWTAALAAFRRVSASRPGHLQAFYQHGLMAENANELAESERVYREILDAAPSFRAAAYRLSRVYARLKRRDDAKRALGVYEAIPDEGQPDTEKCALARVTLVPYDRASHEPAPVAVRWRDATAALLGDRAPEAARGVAVVDLDRDGKDEIVVFGDDVAVVSTAPAPRRGDAAPGGGADSLAIGYADPGRFTVWASSATGTRRLDLTVADGRATWTEATSPPLPPAADLALFDADHDGDLDLIHLAREAATGASLVRDAGDGTWTRMTPFATSLVHLSAASRLDAHDLDQGNDLDLVFAGGASGPIAFLNRRDGTFGAVPLDGMRDRTVVLVEDLDNDGAPDVFVAGGGPGWVLASNADRTGRAGELALGMRRSAPATGAGIVRHAALADVDLDGDFDVVLAGDRGVVVLVNRKGGDLATELRVTDAPARHVAAAQLDDGGAEELVVTGDDGHVSVFTADLAPTYAELAIAPTGKRDNRGAVGAVIELYAGEGFQSAMVKGPNGVRLGVGAATRTAVDGVYVRWPQGIRQSVTAADLALDAPGPVRFDQKEGLVASCPFLYARGPDGWRFLTDVVGIAPLDEWLPPGATPHLDPEEWVRIAPGALAVEGGEVTLAITEELRETTYLDRLELVAVDHAAGLDLYVHEGAPQADDEGLVVHAVGTSALASAQGVTLADGRDATASAAAIDGRYVHGYRDAPPQWSGWVERYAIDFVAPAAATHLLLTGRIAWYDSTVVYALAQHGRTWGPLRLEDAATGEVLVGDLGVPAGMDRTLVVPLPRIAPGTRLRLSGQHRFLWDRIAFAQVEVVRRADREGHTALADGSRIAWRPAPLVRALLGERGYSATSGDVRQHEQTYDYESVGPDDAFRRATGLATRYGDVLPLLAEHDDQVVVLVAGDGVELTFAAPPPPPDMSRRTWFLRVSGWAKEGSFHNRTGRTIEPLPFRAMDTYPPTGEPTDPAWARYRTAWLTRRIVF